MTTPSGSPTEVLHYLVNARFNVFLDYESSPNITSTGKVVTTLVRSVFNHNHKAMRTAVNRLDGLLPKVVNVEMPHVYYLYPNATPNEDTPTTLVIAPTTIQEVAAEKPMKRIEDMTLREATRELSLRPFSMVQQILDQAKEVAEWHAKLRSISPSHTPYTKSIMAAHFVLMASSDLSELVDDFFDTIDGRLAETVRLGEDIYITSLSREAPEGAYLNKDGVLELEATHVQNMWANALDKKQLLKQGGLDNDGE